MRITMQKGWEMSITVEQHGRIELKQIQYYHNSLVLTLGVDNNKLLYYTVVILNDKIHKIYYWLLLWIPWNGSIQRTHTSAKSHSESDF